MKEHNINHIHIIQPEHNNNNNTKRKFTLHLSSKSVTSGNNDSNGDNSNSNNNNNNNNNIEHQFHFFYSNLLEHYEKKHYRKLLSTIEKNDAYTLSNQYWKITHLKIKSIQHIIQRKLTKYSNDKQIPSFNTWLKRYDNEITSWIHQLTLLTPELDINFHNKLELLITFTLNQCYNYAVFCLKQTTIIDCLSFLSLGERLIKHISDYSISPDTMYHSSQIMLFLSSLYISDNSYDTAKNYIIAVLKLSYKELELRIKSDMRYLVTLDETYSHEEKESIYNVFFNFAVAFFHLGVCYEHEHELDKSYHAYQQAKWFGKNIKLNKVSTFVDMLYDIEERSCLRSELVEFFHNEEANVKEAPVKQQHKVIYSYDKEAKMKKYEKIQQYVEGLKLVEVDDDEKDLLNKVNQKPFSNRVSTLTKTIHVLNYLMSEQFKKVVDKMPNIEINKLNKETKRLIQKRIIHLKNTERMRLIKKYNNNKDKNVMSIQSGSNKYFLSSNNSLNDVIHSNNSNKTNTQQVMNTITAPSSLYTLTSRNSPTKSGNRSSYQTKFNNNNNNIRKYTYKNNSHLLSRSTKNITTPFQHYYHFKVHSPPQKIIYSPYVFNKGFRNKISFLDKQFVKELKFQKNLLLSKVNEEGFPFEPFNERKVNHECDNFFTTTLNRELRGIKRKESLISKNDLINKAGIVNHNIKKAFSSKNVFMNRQYNHTQQDKMKYGIREYTARVNQNSLNTIQADLDSLEQAEKSIVKRLKDIKNETSLKRARLIKGKQQILQLNNTEYK